MTTHQDTGYSPSESYQDHAQSRPMPQRPDPWHVNVAGSERVASALIGGALGVWSLSRGGIVGLLGLGLGGALVARGVSGHCSGYSLLGVSTADQDTPAAPEDYFERGIHVEQSFTVNRGRQELYDFWRRLENLPLFMRHLESVVDLGDGRSHWIVRAPAGTDVAWDARIINDIPGEVIAWQSLGGADVDNSGSVRFVDAPGDRGTEVRVVLDYIPPGGKIGKFFAQLLGKNPASQVKEDLRRFKQLMEAGEVPQTQGQPRGTCS